MSISHAEKTGVPTPRKPEDTSSTVIDRLPRLHRGDRAHIMWIGSQAVTYDMEIKSTDSEGKEFSFTLPKTDIEPVMHMVIGTIIKAFPTLKQKRHNPSEPDTLHVKPDLDLMETLDGGIDIVQPATMVIRRQDLDEYIIINHRQAEPDASSTL